MRISCLVLLLSFAIACGERREVAHPVDFDKSSYVQARLTLIEAFGSRRQPADSLAVDFRRRYVFLDSSGILEAAWQELLSHCTPEQIFVTIEITPAEQYLYSARWLLQCNGSLRLARVRVGPSRIPAFKWLDAPKVSRQAREQVLEKCITLSRGKNGLGRNASMWANPAYVFITAGADNVGIVIPDLPTSLFQTDDSLYELSKSLERMLGRF